jgi:hypothetical protein
MQNPCYGAGDGDKGPLNGWGQPFPQVKNDLACTPSIRLLHAAFDLGEKEILE